MKLLLIFLCLNFLFIHGQELVNGDFDSPRIIPNDYGQVYLIANVEESNGTPDLFNIDSEKFGNKNFLGFQEPKSGKGYAGFLASDNEKIAFRFNKCLIENNKYLLSFYVSTAEISECIYTPIVARLVYSPNEYMNIKQDFTKFDDILKLKDTDNWINIKDTLTAKGGENYLIIGFENLNHIFYNCLSYYYIDQVSFKNLNVEKTHEKSVIDTFSLFYNTNVVDMSLDDSLTILKVISNITQKNISKIIVIGNTDSQGNFLTNDYVSNKRADNVLNFLKSIISLPIYFEKKNVLSESINLDVNERRVDIILQYSIISD